MLAAASTRENPVSVWSIISLSSSPLSSSPSSPSSSSFGQFFNKCSHIYSWQTPPKLASLLEQLMKTITIHWFNPYFSPFLFFKKLNRAECVPCWDFLDVTVCRKNYTTKILRANRAIHHVSHWKRWGVKMTIGDGRMRSFSYFVTSKINCHLHLLQLSVPEEKVQILEIFSPLPSYSQGKLYHNTCLS